MNDHIYNRTYSDIRGRGAHRRERHGFTLIELLSVIAIIGMLSAISITTVRASIQSAKETQTRTTIAKIDSAVTEVYEKYQYRRVDLSLVDSVQLPELTLKSVGKVNLGDYISWNWSTNELNRVKALVRVVMLRELVRSEMPQTISEAEKSPFYLQDFTPLQSSYRRSIVNCMTSRREKISNISDEAERKLAFQSVDALENAELLYLIVMNANPEARSNFSDREVADTDGNGLFEFVDGWGNPIQWLRWAPGLKYSDRQPVLADLQADGMDVKMDADPFDPLGVADYRDEKNPQGWFLVPYIFSAGYDGEYGIQIPSSNDVISDPYLSKWEFIGAPDGSDAYKDNIDNHTLVR